MMRKMPYRSARQFGETAFMATSLAARRLPVRVRALLWLVGSTALVLLSIAFVDRPVATWSHDVLRRPEFAVEITKIGGFNHLAIAALVVLLAAIVVRLVRGPGGTGWRTATGAAIATMLAALSILGLKYGFGREWPETWTHGNPSWIHDHAYAFLPFHGGEGFGSFPSGHTARVTAPFAVLWYRLPRLRVLWALPPLIMSAALIAANFHFVGDCIGGVIVGAACAAAVLVYV
jgi:membrane-associated phospholipid phosphatase